MIIYLINLLIPISFILYQNHYNLNLNKKYIIFFFIYLILFVGLREVGSDYQIYKRYYESFENMDSFKLSFSGDVGYDLINFLFKKLNLNFYCITLISSLIFFVGLYFFLNTLPNMWLGLYISLPYYIFVLSMSAIRQSIALGFLFLSIVYLKKNSVLMFYFFILVGTLFHKSLIIFGILYVLMEKIKLKQFLFFLILAISVFFYRYDEFIRILPNYLYDSYLVSDGVFLRVIPIFFSFIIFLYIDKIKVFLFEENEKKIFYGLLIIFLYCLPLIFINTTTLDRLLVYIGLVQIITFVRFCEYFKNSRKIYVFNNNLLIIIYLVYYLIWINFGINSQEFVPYKTIFSL